MKVGIFSPFPVFARKRRDKVEMRLRERMEIPVREGVKTPKLVFYLCSVEESV